jgi:hypothetical protein
MLAGGCAGRGARLDLQGTVLYEKPEIEAISYSVEDDRRSGGAVVVTVSVSGDAGLEGSFDIAPGIVDREQMREIAAGRYEGRFAFPAGVIGGPYTVIGRLQHDKAGEIVLRDPDPLTITLMR